MTPSSTSSLETCLDDFPGLSIRIFTACKAVSSESRVGLPLGLRGSQLLVSRNRAIHLLTDFKPITNCLEIALFEAPSLWREIISHLFTGGSRGMAVTQLAFRATCLCWITDFKGECKLCGVHTNQTEIWIMLLQEIDNIIGSTCGTLFSTFSQPGNCTASKNPSTQYNA